MSGRGSPGHRARAAHLALALALAALALATLACLIIVGLARRPPAWFAPVEADPRADAAAVSLENRLGADLSARRPADQPWTIEIREDQANAWLAARLRPWLEYEGVRWPEDLGRVAVDLAPGRARLGVEAPAVGGGAVLWAVARVHHGDEPGLRIASVGLGSAPIPRALAEGWIDRRLADAAGPDVARAVLGALGRPGLPIDRLRVPIDGERTARVERIEITDGLCRLTLRTTRRERGR